jgi:hypothetical protein
MTPKNYDPSTYCYWYRKVEVHPDPRIHSLTEVFAKHVASWLGIHPPQVFWFEDAAYHEASWAWPSFPGAKRDQSADPLGEPCEYFRWRGSPSSGGYAGYAHHDSPRGIMINVHLRGADLLNALAEECFHISQDSSHGAGWRATASVDDVEGEAKVFLRSKDSEIQAFLVDWERRSSLDR